MSALRRELYIPCESMTREAKGILLDSIKRQAESQGIDCEVISKLHRLEVALDGDNELKIAAYEAALVSWRATHTQGETNA